MTNYYNDYGFSEINGSFVTHVGSYDSNTDTITTTKEAIDGLYSIENEIRDWRTDILNTMTALHEQTRKKVNDHTTEEVTDAEELITNKIEEHDDNITSQITTVKNTQSEHTGLLNRIISTLSSLKI